MFNSKKTIIFALTMSLLALNLTSASFSDIQNHKHKNSIDSLSQKKCLTGFKDGTFRPDNQITRVEVTKLILTCLDLPEIYSEEKFKLPTNSVITYQDQEIKLNEDTEVTFKLPFDPNLYSDLSFIDIDTEAWYIPFLKEGMVRKIINGYLDNTFKPFKEVDKKEFITMLYRAVPENLKQINAKSPLSEDLNPKSYFYEPFQFFLEKNILITNDESLILPNKSITRSDVASIIHNYLIWEEKTLNPIKEVIKEVIKEIPDESLDPVEETPSNDTSNLTPTTATNTIGYKSSGKASYYSDELSGEKTASGELYDPDRLMAAHKTIPFGTLVKVTNVANQKWVNVIISDRGPFVENRIIDLSKSAFESIADLSSGVVNIELEILELP